MARPNRTRTAVVAGLAAAVGLIAVSTATPAHAVEVEFEGFYRARARGFSSLTIDPEQTDAVPASVWAQHRLWLAPRFIVSDKVAIYTEFRGLDGVTWGQAPVAENDTTGAFDSPFPEGQLPLEFTDDLRPPTGATVDGLPRAVTDFGLWRAYAEVHGAAGTFRFGRMPLHWGLGIWQNDGLGLSADYGDSIDRVQWEGVIPGSDVFLRAAGEVDAYGLASADARNIFGGTVAAAYRTEAMEIGLNTQLKRATGGGENQDPFTVVTSSVALQLETGSLKAGAEVVGRVGGGQLGDADVQVRSLGALIVAEIDLGKLRVGLDAGLATGDGNESDDTLTTFHFDRDYNLGIILFEQPMPVFVDNTGRDLSRTLSGNGISNAFFGRAHASYPLPLDLRAELAVAGARAFDRPDAFSDQVVYGLEVDAGLRYDLAEDVDLVGTGAAFIPGSYYGNFQDGENVPDGFSGLVYGGQIQARVSF